MRLVFSLRQGVVQISAEALLGPFRSHVWLCVLHGCPFVSSALTSLLTLQLYVGFCPRGPAGTAHPVHPEPSTDLSP